MNVPYWQHVIRERSRRTGGETEASGTLMHFSEGRARPHISLLVVTQSQRKIFTAIPCQDDPDTVYERFSRILKSLHGSDWKPG